MEKQTENEIVRRMEIGAPVSNVWQALTDHEKFGEWFRVKIDGPFVVGQRSLGKITYPGYEGYPWEATVVAIEPEHYFAYRWPAGAEQGEQETEENWTLVEFRLEAKGNGCVLTLTETGFENIPPNRRSVAFRDNSGGWTIQMQNIKEYVE